MIDKIDGNIPVALLARPIERTGAGAVDVKSVEAKLTEEKAAVAVMPTYDFQFRVNTETQEITAVIVDPNTRAVIREIPAKEMHAAADVIRRLIGPLVDKTV
jgi:uncharacterized FlaG/YvyC family protein